jgi:ADP-ribose pyrophosphatase
MSEGRSESPSKSLPDRIVADTPHLRLIDRKGWFFVDRPGATGVVAIVAVTEQNQIILVEQYRPALAGNVIELPAGLVGDEADHANEPLANAARRELIEETGYDAPSFELLPACAAAPGVSSEVVTFFRARGLQRVGAGGGVAAENIKVHEVPLATAEDWLADRARAGTVVAVKVYAGLWFARAATQTSR